MFEVMKACIYGTNFKRQLSLLTTGSWIFCYIYELTFYLVTLNILKVIAI
jgi:hypothetical protein